MIRAACRRALALVPLTGFGLAASGVGAQQTTPAPTPQQAAPTPTPASKTQLTPAQQKYGQPRNPAVGPLVDEDLSKPLTLERAVQIGLQRQNSIAIAATQADAANARLTIARSSYYPQVTPSVQYTASRTPGFVFVTGNPTNNTTGGNTGGTTTGGTTTGGTTTGGTTGGTTTGGTTGGTTTGGTTTGGGTTGGNTTGGTIITGGGLQRGSSTSESRTDVFAIHQLIWDTGRREANVGFARRSLFANRYGLGNQRQTVVLNVTGDYYTLLRDRELIIVEQKSVERAQTTLDSIRARVQAGDAAQSDTYQAESDLANAQVTLLQAQEEYTLAESSLKNAMGIVTSQAVVLPDTDATPPSETPDNTSLENLVRLAYGNRLDLKQQQETINAQGYNVRIAHINNGLSVDANLTEGYQVFPVSGEERIFTVGISYPLFDGGSTRASVRENKAVLEQDRRTLDQLQQNVRQDVEQALQARELARRRYVASQVAVVAGNTNYQAALGRQQLGAGNILDVINAQVQLVQADVNRVNAIYDFYIADAQLRRNIGANDPVYLPQVPGATPPRLTLNAPPSGTATRQLADAGKGASPLAVSNPPAASSVVPVSLIMPTTPAPNAQPAGAPQPDTTGRKP